MRVLPPTTLAVLVVSLVVPQARAQESAGDSGGRPALAVPYRYPSLVLAPLPALAPGGWLGPRTPPALVAAAWARRVRDSLPTGIVRVAPVDTSVALALEALAVAPGAGGPPQERTFQAAGPGSLGRFASLGMDLSIRFELKADQFRNLRCSSFDRQQAISGCSGGFPTISPDPQYAIRSGGVVGQRLHVNVDFDSQREFDANNNLQVWYEGLQDEILQRVEVGNVSFQAPSSRFISAAIPANNFGVQAVAQIGPMSLRGIYAQQKGNVVRDRVFSVGDVTTEGLDRQVRDLDFEPGRFYFAVDPAALPGYPGIDILNLPTTGLPDSLRVGSLQVYRARIISTGGTVNQNIGGVRAVACGPGTRAVDCSGERVGPFQWELLVAGKDYYVDPSGAWFALAVRSDPNDYIAVSYIPAGQTGCGPGANCVGTFPVTANPDSAAIDTLRLVYDPRPGVTEASPTFRFEIRNAYRIGGSDVNRQSVALTITLNQRERTVASGETYLSALGLALANDPTTFDQYNRLFPRDRDPQQGAPLTDYYVIFPNLRPFADSTTLTPGERNDSLYRTPRSLLAQQGPASVFSLSYHADVSASSDRGTLSLGSFQIREGSERLYLGNRLLVRGSDYTIDYPTGVVTFTNPDSLFQGNAGSIRAQFEERSQFVTAPTAIYGMSARYDLGQHGDVNLTGLFQHQQSPFTRPQLGFEAASNFIGGVTTNLHFQPTWLTQAVNVVPGIHTAVPSFLNVSGEIAVSRPRPNQYGQAYLEEFEGEAGRFISLNENSWHLGSLPSTARGATAFGVPATGFDPLDAAALTWQSLPCNASGKGCVAVQFTPQQIDPTIRLVGQTTSAEPVLWLMLKPDTVMGTADAVTGSPNWRRPGTGPNARTATRWRSITQTLSTSGLDLSRVEYLEFWVWEDNRRTALANRAAILFDFGSVFEDAIAFEPDSFSVGASGDTTYYGMRPAGLGRLDSERDPVTHSWSAATDDEGILGDRVVDGIMNVTSGQRIDTLPLCSATVDGQLRSYAFGDLRSRCTRHNGVLDTEDQDGDNLLDTLAGTKQQEDFVRFVFPIGDDRYFVRTGGMIPATAAEGGGASGWRLYRIPFRSDTLQQGQPDLRQVQALRITVLAPETALPGEPDPQIYFGLSRLRLVGSTWLKRAETPIPGIAGDRGTGAGEVVASVVSTESRDLGYTSPPGVFDQAGQQGANLQLGASQVNEQSLRLLARGLEVGQHAEAFTRFSGQESKNFLSYRKLRVWARGRGPGWEDGDLDFYIKAGRDEENFYLYYTPARTSSWEPEVVVSLDRWLLLRTQIEQAWLAGDPPHVYPGCPGSPIVPDDTAYVMCDGPYVVHIHDPGTSPPNLAAVQEIAAGMLRVAQHVFIDQAELWVDDIRLSDVVQNVGTAGAFDLSVGAADVFSLNATVTRRDGNFRQLNDAPSYLTTNAASLASTIQLEKLLPAAWGLSAPLSIRYTRSSSAPYYLDGTDLRGDALTGLRTPLDIATSYALTIRRVRRSSRPLARWLVDPITLTGFTTSGYDRSSLASASARSSSVTLDYSANPSAAYVPAAPGFLVRILQGIPLLNRLPFVRKLGRARIRATPAALRFRSSLASASGSRYAFRIPVVDTSNQSLLPARSESRLWRNSASLELRPLTGLQMRLDVGSQRDLRDYGDSTTIGLLTRQGRRSFLGHDVGLETQRTVNTLLSLTPNLTKWLRPRMNIASTFTLNRDPNGRQPIREVGDSTGAFHVPAAFAGSQRLDAGSQIDLAALARGLFGDSAVVSRWLARVTRVEVSWNRVLTSSFNRVALSPSLGYQLGLGGIRGFRAQGADSANAAQQRNGFGAGASASLPLGFRITTRYQSAHSVTWAQRTQGQVPLTSYSRDWPVGTLAWTLSPGGWLRRVLSGISAQVTQQVRTTMASQASLATGGATLRTHSEDRSLTPSVSVTWAHGVLTTFDGSRQRTEQQTAGNTYLTSRGQRNVSLTFSWKPPAALVRLKGSIRTTARYATNSAETCLQTAGGEKCVPYVDSRQRTAQLTLDTSFPPSLSAGFQMAYVLNDERQISRRTSQLVITAFVQFNTSVGQVR